MDPDQYPRVTISLESVLSTLQSILSHDSPSVAPEEMPDEETPVDDLDVEGFLRWCSMGLHLFGRSKGRIVPHMSDASRAAKNVVLGVAVLRTDRNITRMAVALNTSRRACREALRAHGLYPLRKTKPAVSGAPASPRKDPPDQFDVVVVGEGVCVVGDPADLRSTDDDVLRVLEPSVHGM